MIRNALALILLCIISILILEGLLRVLGRTPYVLPKMKIESHPINSIIPDEKYGFKLVDGQFKVIVNSGLEYSVHHIGGRRVTKFSKANNDLAVATMEFHGCSFTYGTGVDDSLTFPFLVQQQIEELDITNYAVPGYGTIQTLLKLQEKSQQKLMPDILILCYADFHNERDELKRSYQEKISIGYQLTELKFEENIIRNWSFPYGVLENEKILIKNKSFYTFRTVSLFRRNSALWHQLAQIFETQASQDVSLAAIGEINELCKTNNTKLIVAAITGASSIKDYCAYNNINLWNVYVPINMLGFNLMPYDSHPSSKAHKEYARLIVSNIEKEKLNTIINNRD